MSSYNWFSYLLLHFIALAFIMLIGLKHQGCCRNVITTDKPSDDDTHYGTRFRNCDFYAFENGYELCCTYDSFSTSAPDTTTHKQPPETTSLSTSSDPGLTPITQTTKIPVFTSPPTTTTDGGVATTAAPAPAPTIVHTTNPLDKTTFVPTTETGHTTSLAPTTATNTTIKAPTTIHNVTAKPQNTTHITTTNKSTTAPLTLEPTSPEPKTSQPATSPPATSPPTTSKSTTSQPATSPPTKSPPATSPPTTSKSTTSPPTTSKSTTSPPVTSPPTTSPQSTSPPATSPPTTSPPATIQGTTYDKQTTASETTEDITAVTSIPTTTNVKKSNEDYMSGWEKSNLGSDYDWSEIDTPGSKTSSYTSDASPNDKRYLPIACKFIYTLK
ncbi:uncharacterized protein LOC142352868 [Convolutriloba macropyga]|uniref:uncharacterized protein LOC142352868 n=1 Tax=Convolutriloba macropyga TaxID=536237 RepID=UPI003F526BBD